jgi:hypothetical protein
LFLLFSMILLLTFTFNTLMMMYLNLVCISLSLLCFHQNLMDTLRLFIKFRKFSSITYWNILSEYLSVSSQPELCIYLLL